MTSNHCTYKYIQVQYIIIQSPLSTGEAKRSQTKGSGRENFLNISGRILYFAHRICLVTIGVLCGHFRKNSLPCTENLPCGRPFRTFHKNSTCLSLPCTECLPWPMVKCISLSLLLSRFLCSCLLFHFHFCMRSSSLIVVVICNTLCSYFLSRQAFWICWICSPCSRCRHLLCAKNI